jgi:hypothetical protein
MLHYLRWSRDFAHVCRFGGGRRALTGSVDEILKLGDPVLDAERFVPAIHVSNNKVSNSIHNLHS